MKPKICIVGSRYYPEILRKLMLGVTIELKKNGITYKTRLVDKTIYVPGIFEIPVTIAKNIKFYDAFIALGCVIKGKTPHFDFISNAVTNAIMHLSITHQKPIGNGIITCLNKKQAIERANPKKKNKGGEAARAILSVLGIIKSQ